MKLLKPTQGVKYAGSKLKLIPTLLDFIDIDDFQFGTVCDAFSGSTRVGQAFHQLGLSVTGTRDSDTYNPYEDFRAGTDGVLNAVREFTKLIDSVNCNYLLVSYSSNGIIPIQTVEDILADKYKLVFDYGVQHATNVMGSMVTDKTWVNDNLKQNTEFVLLFESK